MKKERLVIKAMFVFAFLCFNFFGAIAQNEIHVYSTEIPWIEGTITEDPSKIYSINEAIGQASSGDAIIIHEGIYRERILVNKNNLTFRNHQNDYVLVTGAEVVTGTWTDASGLPGVKVINISGLNIETDYSQLFSDGHIQKLGRHPNRTINQMMEVISPNNEGGFAPLINGSKPAGANATGQITFDETTLPNVDLTGGVIRAMTGKMRRYVYGNIVGNSGNTVSFKATNNNTDWKAEGAIAESRFKFSWGFVLHKNLVDTPGEWFIEGDNLYYFPRVGENINNSRIELQIRERVLVLNNQSGINIEGINFVAGNVDAQSTNSTSIDKCTFRYLYPFWTPNGYGQNDTDKKGIYLRNSSNNSFKDTYIGNSWGNMVALISGDNNSFENCTIDNFGWVGVFASGIHINKADNTSISKCTFGEAGRFHIRIDGGDAKVDILDSDFYGAMKLGEDAGSLQGTSTGRIGSIDLKGSTIAYNKVHDVQGLPVSDGNYNKQKIVAFYMEDIENYTAHHNLIYNFKSDNYNGSVDIERVGEFLYLGPRYNRMQNPVNYYNNTVWNYDEFCSIWNIEIDNWQELGVPEADASGSMEDGHFANNIFMNESVYRLSYVRQVLSSTGGNLGWVTLNPSPSLNTTDWDEYTTHCANYNYMFNPENNVLMDFSSQGNNFVDASNGDFTLLNSSTAKNAGIEISGITSSSNPDAGALEGGNRVLNAGSDLTIPDFLEKTTLEIEVQYTIAVSSETCPDKNNGTINIVASISGDYEITLDGTNSEFTNEKLFENIATGEHDICIRIKGESQEQCFIVNIAKIDGFTSKTLLNNKNLQVEVTSGTPPYTVELNNKIVLKTMASSFSLAVSQGDIVKVKTDKDCEGELIKSIDFYADVQTYPNPTSGRFQIAMPIDQGRIPIEIYDIQSRLISSKVYTINDGKINFDLTSRPAGIYFAKLVLDQALNIKIVKH